MDDSQEQVTQAPDNRTLAELISQSEADQKAETPPADEAKTETDQASEAEPDAGDDASAETKAKDGEDKPAPEPDEDEKPKRSKSGIARLKARNAQLEAELTELRNRAGRDSGVSQEAIEREIGPPPKEEDFAGDFLRFERAATAYELDKRQVERELRKSLQHAETQKVDAMRELVEAHQERVEEFRGQVKDFDQTLKSSANLKASPTVESLILESDKSAHLIYHLAKNPDRLDRLNRMSEREAAREIGRIESRLSLPSPKVETKAPKPVTPPKGGAAPRTPETDMEAYLQRTYGDRYRK